MQLQCDSTRDFWQAVIKTGRAPEAPRISREQRQLFTPVGARSILVAETFDPKKVFVPGSTTDGITVGIVGPNFRRLLERKGEEKGSVTIVREHLLLRKSYDQAIIDALGGAEKVEIELSQYWEYLKTVDRQWRYIAYVKDDNGTAWSVLAHWYRVGLCIEAAPLNRDVGWRAQRRFLTR